QHRVPLREGAALAVLSRQADGMPFLKQRAEGERLTGRPIDPLTGFNRLGAIFKETLDGLVRSKVRWNDGDLLANIAQHSGIDAGVAAARIVGVARRLHAGPAAVEPICLVRLVALSGLEFGVEARAPIRLHLVDFALGDDTFADKLLAVDFQRGRVRP